MRTPLLLLLTFAAALLTAACEDDPAADATGSCADVTCDPGQVCVAGTCRATVDNNSGNNAENNSNNNENNALNNADPSDVGADADVGELIDATSDAGGEDVAQDAPEVEDTGACSGCARIEADPAQLGFTVGMVGQVVERRVLLVNTGERSVSIRDVQVVSAAQGFSIVDPPVGQAIERGAVLEFGVQYEAGSLAAVTADVQVFTSIPSVVTIPVTVTTKDGTVDPCMEVTPTRIGFGAVPRGQSMTRQVRVANCGSVDLQVNRLERGTFFGQPTPASFQWAMTPQEPTVLAPGAAANVAVTYTPGRAGLDIGYFNVHSNDATTAIVRVDLTGTAQPPPMEEQELHIQLEWDSDGCDVDLHFVREGDDIFDCPLDCFYANPNPDWGTAGDWTDDPFLDFDNIQGFGPENINVQRLQPGTWRVFLHYYLDSYEQSASTSTNATVRIYSRGQLLGTFGPQHLDATGRIWDVALIEWPAARVTPLGQTSTTSLRTCR